MCYTVEEAGLIDGMIQSYFAPQSVSEQVRLPLKGYSGVDRQEFQFPQQGVRSLPNAEEKINQLGIQIVVNIQPLRVWRQAEEHGTAAAKRLQILRNIVGKYLTNIWDKFFLSTDPWDERPSDVAHPPVPPSRKSPVPVPIHE